MRRTIATLTIATVLAPGALFAQTAGLCSITRTLARGMSGNDVTVLQTHLNTERYLAVSPTGYFGTLTEAALANWQLKVGIIASISGGGVYGPKTKAYVARTYCGGTAQPTATNQCVTAPPQPSLTCAGAWQKTYNATSCHVGWTCVVLTTTNATNKVPVVTGITGPSKTKMGESGTWSIAASDQENSSLSYNVIWGDEGSAMVQLLELAELGTIATTSATFRHSYTSGGNYTIVIFVKDTADNVAKATFAVFVETPPPPPIENATTMQTNNIGQQQTSAGSGQCVYNGITYDSGYAAPNVAGGPQPGQYGWNSGHLYVCNAGVWAWKQCGWPNLTGPFPNTTAVPTKTGEGRFYACP